MRVRLDAIEERLYQDLEVRERILADFGITSVPKSPHDFAEAVVGQFGQVREESPLDLHLTNAEVFRAAVQAIASNSRSWTGFVRLEPSLARVLQDYDPILTHGELERGTLALQDIKAWLPGLTSSADASAIARWAALLTTTDGYYSDGIRELALEIKLYALSRLGHDIADSRLALLLVGFLAGPLTSFSPDFIRGHRKRLLLQDRLPGMSYTLASEFFRNLHWSAFKPDRHVMRLFDYWCPSARFTVETEVSELQTLIGRKAGSLDSYLRYSLIGIAATPPDTPITYVDNLVWLLGSYVERKNKESTITYMEC